MVGLIVFYINNIWALLTFWGIIIGTNWFWFRDSITRRLIFCWLEYQILHSREKAASISNVSIQKSNLLNQLLLEKSKASYKSGYVL